MFKRNKETISYMHVRKPSLANRLSIFSNYYNILRIQYVPISLALFVSLSLSLYISLTLSWNRNRPKRNPTSTNVFSLFAQKLRLAERMGEPISVVIVSRSICYKACWWARSRASDSWWNKASSGGNREVIHSSTRVNHYASKKVGCKYHARPIS